MFPSEIGTILDLTVIPGVSTVDGTRWTGAFDSQDELDAFMDLCEESTPYIDIVPVVNHRQGRYLAQWWEREARKPMSLPLKREDK